jgi:GDP-D-mannose dehydratase
LKSTPCQEFCSGHCIVAVDPRCFRPTEVETLLGDPTKAREKLGWVPDVNFADVVREMIWAISVPRVGATMPRRPAPELLLPRWR